jgi:cytochrome c-type biogenesis protein CcmF
MHLAHLGIAVFVIGVAMVGGYQEEKDVRMEPGDTVQVGGYNFRLLGVKSGARAQLSGLVSARSNCRRTAAC